MDKGVTLLLSWLGVSQRNVFIRGCVLVRQRITMKTVCVSVWGSEWETEKERKRKVNKLTIILRIEIIPDLFIIFLTRHFIFRKLTFYSLSFSWFFSRETYFFFLFLFFLDHNKAKVELNWCLLCSNKILTLVWIKYKQKMVFIKLFFLLPSLPPSLTSTLL